MPVGPGLLLQPSRRRRQQPNAAKTLESGLRLSEFSRARRCISAAHAAALTASLGYCPPNALDVIRARDDAPAVVVAHPLLHRKGGVEPFPTTYVCRADYSVDGSRRRRGRDVAILGGKTRRGYDVDNSAKTGARGLRYWIADPRIAAAVATIERDGGVRRAGEHVSASAGGVGSLKSAHARYAAERWALLAEDEVAFVEARGWTPRLRDVGVAGIRDAATVKCLHAHYAHFLADRENPVGAWVHGQLSDEVRALVDPG